MSLSYLQCPVCEFELLLSGQGTLLKGSFVDVEHRVTQSSFLVAPSLKRGATYVDHSVVGWLSVLTHGISQMSLDFKKFQNEKMFQTILSSFEFWTKKSNFFLL